MAVIFGRMPTLFASSGATVDAYTTPDPFYYEAIIDTEANIDPDGSDNPYEWCSPDDGCTVDGTYAWLEISGSDSYYTFGDTSGSDTYYLSGNDSTPGRTMQSVNYWADGGIIWYLDYDGAGEVDYEEDGGGSSSATPA